MSETAPQFSDEVFLAGFQNLLPTGPIWPRDSDAVQTQAFAALVKGYTRNAAAGVALIADIFPATTVDMLDEWEATLGLPDPCAGPEPTVTLRQAQVTARLIAGGGQSIAYFVNFAKTLGYDITVTQFAPARADALRADEPVYDPAWAFAWQVNAPEFTIEYFCADTGNADDPLATWGNTVLICEMNRLAPAHSTIIFNFTG